MSFPLQDLPVYDRLWAIAHELRHLRGLVEREPQYSIILSRLLAGDYNEAMDLAAIGMDKERGRKFNFERAATYLTPLAERE